MKRHYILAIAVLVLLLGLLLSPLRRGFVYRYPGFDWALTPSFALELKQTLGWSKFYSQFGQDKWIAGVVFPGVKDGYFLEIGAGDGERFSNSKALEDLGWNGIAVEPFPTHWEGRKCLLFKEVLSGRKGETLEFRAAGLAGGIDQYLDRWKGDARQAPAVRFVTTTVEDVLERSKAPAFIHFVSLDTEGSEYAILEAFPFSRYRVGAFAIEHNNEEPKRSQIRKLLEANGYRFVKSQVSDDFYVAR